MTGNQTLSSSTNMPIEEKQDDADGHFFLVGGQNPDDGNMEEIDDSSSSDSSYDWEYFDDDGQPLVDPVDDAVLVPMGKDVWYTVDEADKLLVFAASYRLYSQRSLYFRDPRQLCPIPLS